MSSQPPLARFLMSPEPFDEVYPPPVRRRIAAAARVDGADPDPARVLADHSLLAGVEVLCTGWGAPPLGGALLEAAPGLRLVAHAAGSVRPIVTDELWERGVRVVSAAAANAVPVAEFTVAQVVYALKHGWRLVLAAREARAPVPPGPHLGGVLDAEVGLLSLGAIGRMVAARLRAHGVRVLAHDPYAAERDARALGVELVGLEELFARGEVVSLHAPLLPATTGLVDGPLLRLMRPYATLLNTARGGLVDEPSLVEVLRERPDLMAVLDVTHPEPVAAGSPLLTLPNAVVTPHVAGSMGRERARLGHLVADELERWTAGAPLTHEVTRERTALLA
ncbi:hydroxyacid dehydrogenase [Sphaerisporangium sp. TRM90804]|uniref:hydroxyacid dehydrogenase n=1 Tax=Sphaerisporangium sp. TRM90804 TaxID=3031113 RepID=UPI00244C77ED|nr:hydroxyacid dehydrogenase [Sphaerisporangium sp. TRM90804]MDH2426120.1 hydroxyacid dehydrogenase [Sphaerisporangium sp. TRM90804]